MTIFILCSYLGYGGAEHVAVMLANGLCNKHQVFLITNLNREVTYQIDPDVKLLNWSGTTKNKAKRLICEIKNLRNYVKEIKPDVIIGIMYKCSIFGKLATLGTGIPVIQTEHNSFERPLSAPMSRKDKFLKFYLNRIFDTITVLTDADKKMIGNRLKNVYVMPNPLALQPVSPIPHKKKVVLASGRLDSWHYKGLDILFHSWSRIESKFPEWELQIAGWGSKQSTIDFVQQLAKDAGCENRIQLLGFREDIVNLYKESSIFVLSSRYEGFGLVLIEAMSQGCACVACDYKGRQGEILKETHPSPPCLGREPNSAEFNKYSSQNREDFQKAGIEICENGLLCEPENVEALAQAMDKMISDEELRRKMQENGIERSKYYSIDNTIARWEALINKVVNKA